MKLLAVDDDPDLLALVGFALTNAGYSVVKATDTHEAIRVFDSELPNLVILDINLPSGSRLRRLQEHPRTLGSPDPDADRARRGGGSRAGARAGRG